MPLYGSMLPTLCHLSVLHPYCELVLQQVSDTPSTSPLPLVSDRACQSSLKYKTPIKFSGWAQQQFDNVG